MTKRSLFSNKLWPYIFILPQLIITCVFFIWPSLSSIIEAFMSSDAFGIQTKFIWLSNFIDILSDPQYLYSIFITLIFSFFVAIGALIAGLFMALLVNRISKGKTLYKTLLICPYAVAPAVAGILWRFMFNPAVGIVSFILEKFGYDWNYNLNGHQALFLVIITAIWQQFSYNFIFFLAGLKAIPKSLFEASSLDGAGSIRQFFTIIFPLISPTTFFLLIMNLLYALFDTFGIIHVITQGGPANATTILVYKVYKDGFQGLDYGASAAESVILMSIIIMLTFFQFRYVERKVHY